MMTIDVEQLGSVHGGAKLDGFRHSADIEDRRTPLEVQEDDRWMASLKDQQVGKDFANALRDAQIADQLRRGSDALLRAGAR
jgi:hypothetical protein